ncbi:ATP-dependent DNA helicase [Nephila pilipes]|uniref:ATP-dependent DNA helicase n=1 Tax=Nephila pilipes TaxID=299642 RepID=A0A8X6Q059_NEPPI|nr:ATP-dependent DNA helicase [Nephila pilipes]
MERESRTIEPVVDIVNNQCLILLEDIVTSMSGKSLIHFGLPEPIREQILVINNRKYMSELAYDVSQLIQAVSVGVSKYNYGQKKIYDEVLKSPDSYSSSSYSWQLFFQDALGGTGKTFLTYLLLAKVRRGKKQEGKITIPNNVYDTMGDLITLTDKLYPNIEYATLDSLSWLKKRVILTSTNESADKRIYAREINN